MIPMLQIKAAAEREVPESDRDAFIAGARWLGGKLFDASVSGQDALMDGDAVQAKRYLQKTRCFGNYLLLHQQGEPVRINMAHVLLYWPLEPSLPGANTVLEYTSAAESAAGTGESRTCHVDETCEQIDALLALAT